MVTLAGRPVGTVRVLGGTESDTRFALNNLRSLAGSKFTGPEEIRRKIENQPGKITQAYTKQVKEVCNFCLGRRYAM